MIKLFKEKITSIMNLLLTAIHNFILNYTLRAHNFNTAIAVAILGQHNI